MRLATFGETGRAVPVIGQGTWHLDRADRAEAVATLRAGLDAGMTHIDTAEMYGEAEPLVGEAIAGRRAEVFLASKVVPNHASRAGVVAACERSLRRLGTDHLDVYLLHWPGHHPLEETIAGFQDLEASGKIRAWGVSNFDVPDLDAALAIAGPGRIACNQVLYHLGERAIEHAVLPWCRRNGVALVGYSPFGSGDFPGSRSTGGRVLARLAEAHATTPRGIAAAFLTRSEGTFTIPKTARPERARANAAAGALTLTDADVAALDAAFPRGSQAAQLADVVAPGREFGEDEDRGRGGAAGREGRSVRGTWLGAACGILLGLPGPSAGAEETGARGGRGPNGETLTIGEKGITLTFPDEVATLRIGGKLQLDFGASGIRQPGFPEPFPENIAVRRAWIESYLTLAKTYAFAFQYDFADPMRPINDAAAAYKGVERTLLTAGNMKEPFSLDQLISDNATLFTERSLADAFAPARNVGFAVGRHGAARDGEALQGEAWTLTAGLFGGNANTGVSDEGVAATARATYAPVRTDERVVHLGLAGSFRDLPRDGRGLSLSSRSEAFLFQRNFVDTGTIRDASDVRRIGVEAAWREGPFLVQAEYIRTTVARFGAASPGQFQGGYVQASLVLNGPGRAYALAPEYGATYAIFSGVKVPDAARVSRGGLGVFEIGARFSAIDLDDAGIRGGIERDVTLGLNWYPDRNIRLMADYVRSRASPSALQGGRTIEADTVIGRFQLYW